MQHDIDLKYRAGALATTKSLTTDGTLTAGVGVSTPALTLGGVSIAAIPSNWQPEDYGLIAWQGDPSVFTSQTQLLTNGTIYLSGLRIRKATTITNVHWAPQAAGVTPTAGQNYAALVNSAGTILSSVGVDDKVTATAGTKVTAVLAAPQAVTPGMYWVAMLFNAATAPTLLRTSGQQTGTNNYGLTAATYRYAINGTSATALPANFTPGSNALGPALWAAVS